MKKILYTDKEITLAVKESFSYSEVCRKLGLVPKGGNINTIKKKLQIPLITSYKYHNYKTLMIEKRVTSIYSIITNDSSLIKKELEKPIIK